MSNERTDMKKRTEERITAHIHDNYELSGRGAADVARFAFEAVEEALDSQTFREVKRFHKSSKSGVPFRISEYGAANRVVATLVKEVDDLAHEIGLECRDITGAVLAMSEKERRKLRDGGKSTNHQLDGHYDHSGPFEVMVALEVEAYFEP